MLPYPQCDDEKYLVTDYLIYLGDNNLLIVQFELIYYFVSLSSGIPISSQICLTSSKENVSLLFIPSSKAFMSSNSSRNFLSCSPYSFQSAIK